MNRKDTSSNKKIDSNISYNSISDKSVTHTDHRSKTKSNSISNGITNDYKYTPGADRTKSEATDNKRPSSGNVRGV